MQIELIQCISGWLVLQLVGLTLYRFDTLTRELFFHSSFLFNGVIYLIYLCSKYYSLNHFMTLEMWLIRMVLCGKFQYLIEMDS